MTPASHPPKARFHGQSSVFLDRDGTPINDRLFRAAGIEQAKGD